jgi:hypothetical protein
VRTLFPLLLSGCIGLGTNPSDSKDGRDLDSGSAYDSGDPLDSAGDGNSVPEADAGPDAEGSVGLVVTLDGSGSSDPDGDPLDYAWRFESMPSGSSAGLLDETQVDPRFVPDVTGVYVVSLIVNDGAEDSDEDSVEIVVTEDNGTPVANAGPNETVTPGSAVTLDGSGSTDPDGDPLQFAWTMTTRPSGSSASLSSSSTALPRFTADLAGTYEIALVVTDGTHTSEPDTVRVTADDGGDTGSSGCGCRSGGAPDLGLLALAASALLGLARPRRAQAV